MAALALLGSSCEAETVVRLFEDPNWGGAGTPAGAGANDPGGDTGEGGGGSAGSEPQRGGGGSGGGTAPPPSGGLGATNNGGTGSDGAGSGGTEGGRQGGGSDSGGAESGGSGSGGAESGGSGSGGAESGGFGGGATGGGSGLRMLYRTSFPETVAWQIQPTFRIENTGSQSVQLVTLLIRYWFTDDGVTPMPFCNFISLSDRCDSLMSVSISPAWGYEADSVLEIGFRGGQIAPGGSVEFEARIQREDWAQSNQDNDYSFAPALTEFGYSTKVALYRNGQLVIGREP